MRREWILALAVMIAGCNKTEGEPEDLFGSATKPNGSAGGFSAALAADLKGSGSAAAGSGAGSSTAAKPATPPPTPAPAGSAAAPAPPTPTPTPTVAAGSGSSTVGQTTGKTGNIAPPTPTAADPAMPAPTPKAHLPATVPPELAAIHLKIPAKWMRDVDEAGTFTRDLDAVSQEVSFVFHYGYEEAGAPKDTTAYLAWLKDKKIIQSASDKPLVGRQRSGGLYIEGVDANGKGIFRQSVQYGDKHLICGGPTYRELGLGDFRDAVIVEAKQICESISM